MGWKGVNTQRNWRGAVKRSDGGTSRVGQSADHTNSLHVAKGQGQETLACEGHLGLAISPVNVLVLGLEFFPERRGRQPGGC